jgi:magnesium-transporting ATPase (P-type)
MPSNTLIFAKRSLNLSKIQAGAGLFLTAFGIFTIFALTLFAGSSNAQFFLLPVSFMAFGMLMFTTPVILLYVYDKNNGVLEYLLSLGRNQRDIFRQYLKAALFLALILFIAESIAVMIAGAIAWSQAVFLLDLLALLLTAFLGFSVVSLVTVSMMALSSLQKQRVGANSPLALVIGVVFIFPTFYLSFLGFIPEFIVELSLSILAGALSTAMLILSSRLIRREKMLP